VGERTLKTFTEQEIFLGVALRENDVRACVSDKKADKSVNGVGRIRSGLTRGGECTKGREGGGVARVSKRGEEKRGQSVGEKRVASRG